MTNTNVAINLRDPRSSIKLLKQSLSKGDLAKLLVAHVELVQKLGAGLQWYANENHWAIDESHNLDKQFVAIIQWVGDDEGPLTAQKVLKECGINVPLGAS